MQAKWNGCLLEAYCQQVKRCVELALNCVERERNSRPDIVSIINKLSATENLINAVKVDQQDKVIKIFISIFFSNQLLVNAYNRKKMPIQKPIDNKGQVPFE